MDKREYCKTSKMCCEICGRGYDGSKFELHHKDGDKTNNEDNNLIWLCNSCHKKEHYKMGRVKCFGKGIPTTLSMITSIDYLKTEMTYDVEMADPAHTFVSQSGLVTSNSHSLSYAYDSLYGAYLKSHYPLEYYTVALNYYNGDTERTTKLTGELQYFGIQLKPVKFRYSRSDYAPSKSDNSIYKGVESVKDLNAKVAEELYDLRDNKYDSFIDLLTDISRKTSIKKNQTRILVELDYFNEFGEANDLLAQLDMYNNLSGRSQVNKSDLESFGLSIDTLIPFVGKETEKMLMNIDFDSYIRQAAKDIHTQPRKLSERVKSQLDYLGYITIVGEEYG